MSGNTGLCVFLFVFTCIPAVWASGTIKVTLLGYDNHAGLDQNGQCCDGIDRTGCPIGKCDHHFELCLKNITGTRQGDCLSKSGPTDDNSPSGKDLGSFIFNVDFLEETYVLTINVTDVDSDQRVPVDTININIKRNEITRHVKAHGSRKQQPTSLDIQIEHSCDQYFFQDDCSKKCVPADDCTGHYNCSVDTGGRICLDGWRGPTCTEVIPGSKHDCSIYKDSAFVSSTWSGVLICPDINRSISMNITKMTELVSSPVSGYVTIDQLTTAVTGYINSGLLKTVLLDSVDTEVGSSFNISTFSLDGNLENQTVMSGPATLNGDMCSIRSDRVEGYFDACQGRGTCVRYGENKDYYYCCCDDNNNKQSSSCTTAVTTPATTAIMTTQTTTTTTTTKVETTESSTTTMESNSSSETTAFPTTELTSQQTTTNSSTVENTPPTEPVITTPSSTNQTTTGSFETTESSSASTSELTTMQSLSASTSEYTTILSSPASTSESATESTTSALTSTAIPTTTTLPTTPPSTEPTTTEKPTVFEPTKVYVLAVEATDVELEGEEEVLQGVLIDAWTEANKLMTVLPKDSYNITIIEIKGAIGQRGVLVVEVSYTVSVTIATVNMSQLVSPTKAHLTTSLQRRFNIDLYRGVSFLYTEYSFSVYIKGRPPLVDQFSEINEYISDIWNQTGSMANCSCFNITTSASEEYIGENGEEVSRIYFFVYKDDNLFGPVNITQPNITSLGRYEVYPYDDVTSLVRYRFAYSLNIEGEVTDTDKIIIKERIELSWNESVSTINITLLRCERYISVHGTFITKVIYVTRAEGLTVLPVKSSGPSAMVFINNFNVTNSHGALFVLYTGVDYFRYAYHLGLYVTDLIDIHDIDRLLEGLENAWETELLTTEWGRRKFKLRYITLDKYIGKNDQLVEMLLYYLTEDGKILDGTQFRDLEVDTLSKYIKVKKGNGKDYKLVSSMGLIEQRLHLHVIFKGVVLQHDRQFLRDILLGAWKISPMLSKRTLDIRLLEEMITQNGEVVTRVFYTYYEDGIVARPNLSLTPLFYIRLKRHLVSMSRGKHESYEVYETDNTGLQALVPRKYLLHLYFESQVARLDYVNLQTHLKTAYIDISQDITVTIKRQEEYYTKGTTTSRCWKLSYIIFEGSKWLYPGFHTPVNRTHLAEILNVTALTGRKYTLYQGEITSLVPYSSHFQLHFRERVAEADWFHIKRRVETAWNVEFKINVSVTIQDVEEVISQEGTSYWRLIYFLTEVTSNERIYSGSWKSLDLTKVNLAFSGYYGTTYTVVDYSLSLWRVSSTFRLLSNVAVMDSYVDVFKSNLISTWCSTLKEKGRTHECDKFKIHLTRPQYVKLASGIAVWKVYYLLEYEGFRVTSLTWPTFDLDTFTTSIRDKIPVRFYYWWDFDLSFLSFRFFLNFKSKLDTKDYAKVEATLLESWKRENKEYMNSTNAKVVIDTQTQVFTETGETEWKIGYHIEVNGTLIRPEETRHVNKTRLQTDLLEKDDKLEITIETSTNTTYISRENLAYLFVQSTIHKEDYEKFRISLENYYRNKTGENSTITVVLGPVEEVVTNEGKTEWKLTYSVKKNGEVIHPEPVDTTEMEFHAWFNFKSMFGQEYKLYVDKKKETHTKASIFEVNLKGKVSITSYKDIQEKLKEAISIANPDLVASCMSCLSVRIFGQEETVTETGETVWRLKYGVSINGSNVDASFITAPSSSDLRRLLVFRGTSGVENGVSEVSSTETYSYLSLHELHFNMPVSEVDLVDVTEAVRESWAVLLNVSASDLEVEYKNSKEYLTSKGKSFWSWTYSLKWKSTLLTRTDLSVHEKELKIKVKDKIATIETTRGDSYTLVETTDIVEYSKHFPLHFTVKVAKKDMVTIEKHLEKVWSEEKGINVTVDIVTQQEVIDESGTSYWELVYFVTSEGTKEGDTLLDSRVEEYSNVSNLLAAELANMTDVNEHAYKVVTSLKKLFRADLTFSLHLSARFGVKEETQLKTFIENTVREQINASTTENITVEFLKEEEVTTGTFESVWKYLVSIKINGKTLNPLSSLNGSWPFFEVITSTGHHLTIRSSEYLGSYYNFRSSFSFHLEKNISISSWTEIKEALNRSWFTFEEYKDCNCLTFELGSIHEVVDTKGRTFFKILYFMKQNSTLVDSMVSRKLSIAILKSELKEIRSVDGQSNNVVDVTEEMTTRVDTLFGFFMNRKLRIPHWKLMEYIIKKAYVNELMINTTEVSVIVDILRQTPYISISGERLWRIEYQLRRQHKTLNADVTVEMNITSIQEEFSYEFGIEENYIIQEVKKYAVIDFRHKVELFFSAPIAEKNLMQIKEAFNTSYGLSFANILILNSEELIDEYGKSVWQLSAFIYYGDGHIYSYIPGWGLDSGLHTINMTSLRSAVNAMKIVAATGFVEMLEITGEGLRHHESSHSILVKNVIKTMDTKNITIALEELWTSSLTDAIDIKPNVTVEISRQEELVDTEGNTFSRLVYFLTMDGKTLTSQDVLTEEVMTLQKTLTSHLTEDRKYEVVMETDLSLFRYESLFVLYMKSPILIQDFQEFGLRLETAWEKKSASVGVVSITSKILLQEEMISSNEREATWRVSYCLHRDSKMVDSRSEVDLNETDVKAALVGKFNKTSKDYSSFLVSPDVSKSVFRYSDFFFLHLTNRVAKTDYVKFEVALETFWEMDIENATVEIYKQEELLNLHGESIWKLSYVIMSQSQVVSSQKRVQVAADVIRSTVNVTSPRGLRYGIVDVTETVRLEEVYKLYVTRKVYRGDIVDLKESVQVALKNLVRDDNRTEIDVEWKGQTEFKHTTAKETSAWRQLFLVKMNKKYITPLLYGSLSDGRLNLNFTSVKGDNYELLNSALLSTAYARADEQFTITVQGRIQENDHSRILLTLQSLWNNTYQAGIAITIRSTEEYIGEKGSIITRLSFYALNGSNVIDPDTMLSPSVEDILHTLNTNYGMSYTAYNGMTAVKYKSCFTLLLRGVLAQAELDNLLDVLKRAWGGSTGDIENSEIIFHKMESFVGEFGITLTQILYTVRVKGIPSEFDDDIPPTRVQIEADANEKSSWKLYSGNVYFRLDAMFHISVQLSSEINSEQIASIESGISKAWGKKNNGNECSSCKISIVYGNSFVALNRTDVIRISSISYTVTSEKKTITPWSMNSPTIESLADSINSQSEGVKVWNTGDSLYELRNLYLSGYSSKLDRTKVKTAIYNAWENRTGSETNVSGEIREVELYSDKDWNKITRVQYFVSINSSDPDHLSLTPPSSSEVNSALDGTGLKRRLCECKGLKLRKLYVKGTSMNYTAVATALKESWILKNNDSASLSSSLEVKLKQAGNTRRRRAVPTSGLVDEQGTSVSPLDYTVSIDGQDPDPMFVQPPSQEDVDNGLQTAGVENCKCNPGRVAQVKLKGNTKDEEKKDIADAVKDAIAKSNPDVDPKDLAVQILRVDNHDENGEPVSDVTYAVRRNDNDNVEALTSPSEAHLAEALKAKGKALASEETATKETPDEGRDWEVPVAIVCAILGFIIICIIVFYIVYVRRHRKKAHFKETEENIENNIHNEEHFTNPVMFNNPMYGSAREKHHTMISEGL